MVIELLILFYIVSVLMSIMLMDEEMNITLEDFTYSSFYPVLLFCFIPLVNFVVILVFIDMIKKKHKKLGDSDG